jgi:short subunit dehydrogenase-like uncharacterized protein
MRMRPLRSLSGARIMFSCGYDSLPFELGVFCAQEEARRCSARRTAGVKTRVRAMKGTFSGGTLASAKRLSPAAGEEDP